MSTWNELISHPLFGQIKSVYNDQFPIEVRFVCANWIEERMKTECTIDINHPQIKDVAKQFLRALIEQLKHEKQQLNRVEQLSIQFRLDAAIELLTNHLLYPFAIYKQIRDTISYEVYLGGNVFDNRIADMDEEAVRITQQLNILKNEVLTNKEKQTNYKHEIENYKVLEYREALTQTIQVHNALEQERRSAILEDLKRKKHQFIASINARSIDLNQSIEKVILQIDSVQKLLILNRLSKWHRDQALAGNGAALNTNSLDEIQLWFEKLADIIWTVRCSIEATREINCSISFNTGDAIEQAYNNVTAMLKHLIASGFIVEKQPPQVLKTDFKFTATVRLLTANLGIQLNNPSVDVSFCFDPQSKETSQNSEILNNTGKLDIEPSTHHLSCTLKNMKLKKFRRAERKEGVNVTDEKYALVFKSIFRTADIEINVSVISVPVVVIVHTYQEPQSWATITWDNAFSQVSRVPFHVAEIVDWSHLIGALNMKFTSETDRPLTTDCLAYLCEKAFGTTVDIKDRSISWTQFCKAPLPGRTFSFWDWFYSVMKLIKSHLPGPWTDGSIVGYIDKRQTVEQLQQCQAGTFLLRFSESELGAVSIALIGKTSPPSVLMLQPFFSEDLKIRSLADRIRDIDQCVTLYPNVPKDVAFKKYYSPDVKRGDNGYVPAVLKTTISDATSRHTCICKENGLQLGLDQYGDPAESFDFLSCP